MTGRTCANCGWNDNTVVDEVWGLPAPESDRPTTPGVPPPPAPPATVIAVPPQGPTTMPMSQPVPAGGYSAPPPPVPPTPAGRYPSGSPVGPPSTPPHRSRTGLVIAAVVGVLVLAVGAFFVFGGDGDGSATDDTRTERTERTDDPDDTRETDETEPDETTPDETTPDETDPDSTEAPGPASTDDPTVPSQAPDPNRDYPDTVRTNFLDACEEGSPSTTCECILDGLETIYTLEEFAALEQAYVATGEFGADFTQIVAGCQ